MLVILNRDGLTHDPRIRDAYPGGQAA